MRHAHLAGIVVLFGFSEFAMAEAAKRSYGETQNRPMIEIRKE